MRLVPSGTLEVFQLAFPLSQQVAARRLTLVNGHDAAAADPSRDQAVLDPAGVASLGPAAPPWSAPHWHWHQVPPARSAFGLGRGRLPAAVYLFPEQAPFPAVGTELRGIEPSALEHHRELVGSSPALWVFLRCRYHLPLQPPAPGKSEPRSAYGAGSSFSSHQPEQPRCIDALICSIKPPAGSNGEASTFLAEGVSALARSQPSYFGVFSSLTKHLTVNDYFHCKLASQ